MSAPVYQYGNVISNLIDKMQSLDKDFRFMAINDLIIELQRSSFYVDPDTESKIIHLILNLFEDKNGEVQNLAVKCMSMLITRVKESNIEIILNILCNNLKLENTHLRDISCMGLKNILNTPNIKESIPLHIYERSKSIFIHVYETHYDSIINGYENENVIEPLDVVTEVLIHHGNLINTGFMDLSLLFVNLIQSKRQVIRKKAAVALGALIVICNQEDFHMIINRLYHRLNISDETDLNYVQAFTHICRVAGSKFNNAIINEYTEAVEGHFSLDNKYSTDEIRDYCFQTFEALLACCGYENRDFIEKTLNYALKFIGYDPNYNYSLIEEDLDDSMDADNEMIDDFEDDYSDDEDFSWKVRRSALKCIEAAIVKYPQLLNYFHEKLIPTFVNRLKERKENVKSVLINVFITLLKQTDLVNSKAKILSDSQAIIDLSTLTANASEIYKHFLKLLCDQNMKIRQDTFQFIQEIIKVIPNFFKNDITPILDAILVTLQPASNEHINVKLDALILYNKLITSHEKSCFFNHVPTVTPVALRYAVDNFNKISSEAILLLENLVLIIKDAVLSAYKDSVNFHNNKIDEYKSFIPKIYNCAMDCLKKNDVDQDIKERAMLCLSHVIASFNDDFLHMQFSVDVFFDRLRSENIRLVAVKSLINIVKSNYNYMAIKPKLKEIIDMSIYLRQRNRILKLTTLILLQAIVEKDLESNLDTVIKELPQSINESDLQISQMVMNFLSIIIIKNPSSLRKYFRELILPAILKLLKSSLLQGNVLKSVLKVIKQLSNLKEEHYASLISLNDLTQELIKNIIGHNEKLSKQAFYSSAKAVAIVVYAKSIQNLFEAHGTIQSIFIDIGRSNNDNDVFYLLIIGEIGKKMNLAFMPNLTTILVNDYFSHSSDDVKIAASYAYGILIIGNLDHFLPSILEEISSKTRKQYLLLNSLHETISYLTTTPEGIQKLMPYVESIYQSLIPNCDSIEEGIRNLVAECLAKISLIRPEDYLFRLKNILDTQVGATRATIITTFKCIISDQSKDINEFLESFIEPFLSLIHDKDIKVRRHVLLTLNAIAYNNPKLIFKHLPWILPALYEETIVQMDLIREVEMGPFRHTVDDGLDHRKTAFECMFTLLNTCTEYLDMEVFIRHLEIGLNDHYDVKMICYLMTSKLAEIRPNDALKKLDVLFDALLKTLTIKVKSNAVKQEFEKIDELKRAALRTTVALLKIPEARKTETVIEFYKFLRTNSDINSMYISVSQDEQFPVDASVASVNLSFEMEF